MPHSDHMSYCTSPGDRAGHGVHGDCETTLTVGATTVTVSGAPCSGVEPEVRGVVVATSLLEFDTGVELLRTVRRQVEKWRAETICSDVGTG